MEKKRTLKHKWVRRSELLPGESGDDFYVCKSCGTVQRADGKNKNKGCYGLVKITMRQGAEITILMPKTELKKVGKRAPKKLKA